MKAPTADEIADAIESSWILKGFIWFRELRVGTGFGAGKERRIDMWGIQETPSNARRTAAIEIKRSKSDYYRDTNNPQKRRGALLHSNQFYYAAPAGMINRKTLPRECGLIEMHEFEDGLMGQVLIDAPFEERFPPSWHFVMSICRQLKTQ